MVEQTIKTTTIVDNGITITTTVSETKVEEKSGNPFNALVEIFEAPLRGAEEFVKRMTS